MAGPGFPVNIDSTYADDAGDPSVKAHQQYHDTIHGMLNTIDTSITSVVPKGTLLESDGSIYAPVMPMTYDQPNDFGLKAWTHDFRYLTSASALTAGVVYLTRIRWSPAALSGSTIGVTVAVGTAGTGATALANCFVGLYRVDTSALIGSSASQNTVWNSTGQKDVGITLTADKSQGIDVWGALLIGTQSSTACAIYRAPNAISPSFANGKSVTMNGTFGTGLSALPATLGTVTQNSTAYYFGLF